MTALAPTLQLFFTEHLTPSATSARRRSPPTATHSGSYSPSPPTRPASSPTNSTSTSSTRR